MANLEYHFGQRGYPGYTVTVTAASGNVYREVVPAHISIDSTGAEVGTSGNPLYVVSSGAASTATGTATQVAANAAAVTVLTANSNRRGGSIYYDGAATLYLLLSTAGTPSATVWSIKMGSGLFTYFEIPSGFTGTIKGIWSSAVGSANVMEYTA